VEVPILKSLIKKAIDDNRYENIIRKNKVLNIIAKILKHLDLLTTLLSSSFSRYFKSFDNIIYLIKN
jgi:hypothetical protein